MLDASGNYAGGFFYGQNLRPANPEQCYQLNTELNLLISQAESDNQLFNTTTVVPFFVQIVNAKYVTYSDNIVRPTFLIRL